MSGSKRACEARFRHISPSVIWSVVRKKAEPEKRVVGIGGIFLKAEHPDKLSSWYRDRLGLNINNLMGTFTWNPRGGTGRKGVGMTVWAIFPSASTYFSGKKASPGSQRYMVNYRVRDLRALLKKLRKEGVKVDRKVEESEYGKFGWVTDPEGNRIELWEPPLSSRTPDDSMPME